MEQQKVNLTLLDSEELNRFYEEKFYFSYSGINKLLYSPRLFYNHYILKQKEDSTDAHLVAGRAVHCLLLEPDNFDDYFVLLPGKIPTDSNKVIIDHIFNNNYLPMQNNSLTLDDFPQEILGQLLVNNLYQSLKTDTQRLEKILTDSNKEYFDFLKIRETKTVIDAATKQRADDTVAMILSNDTIKQLLGIGLGDVEGVSVYNELAVQLDLSDQQFGFKGIIDNVVVDENTKTIFINDLKLTSKPIQDFPDSVDYYRYDIQSMIYRGLVFDKFLRHRGMEEMTRWQIVFTFVVVDKYNLVYPYQVSEETTQEWKMEFGRVLEVIKYHYNNRDYNLPYNLALGNVKL
jgi:hypothetical protein